MQLEEFAIEFLESSLITVDEENISQEDSITNDILEYTIDSGEVIAGELCHYKVRGIKINAWNYDEENEAIDLFVTIFKGETRLQKVADKDIEDAFSKGRNFFWSARNGKLSARVDESDTAVFDLIQIIEQTKETVKNVRIFVFTNGQASTDIIPEAIEEDGVYTDFQLWDIERIYQQYLIRSGKQKIEIDFVNDYNHKLKCLNMDRVSDKVDAYLAIIPGKILAEIYKKYKQGLLEKNVRTFLQFKAKVNQGIRDTIRKEPDMFFAYNNGISTTAESVEVEYDGNVPYITRIDNWQVVNGGQTTASIFATYTEKGSDLSKVFVQMKISVIQQKAEMEEIVPKISRFANSQTAIKDSDFSSNSDYHVAIENFSRTEWVPSNTGGKATDKWFYERTRGQFLDERTRLSDARDIRTFDKQYPKKKKFTKTDLSKFEMSWIQRPYDVGKGAENNFKIFTKELLPQINEVGKRYYHQLIAKAILFKEIDKIVMKKNLGGYKANMVSYILSFLSYKSNKQLNLNSIWETQTISDNLVDTVNEMIPIVWKHINSPLKTGMNIGEWCKKLECWITLKDRAFNIDRLNEETSDDEGIPDSTQSGIDLNPQELKIIEEAKKISPETWFAISKWAKENNRFTPFDRKLAYNLGVLSNRKAQISLKQAKNGIRIFKEAMENHFNE